jgi:uncharacterized Zn ribbon protein
MSELFLCEDCGVPLDPQSEVYEINDHFVCEECMDEADAKADYQMEARKEVYDENNRRS